MPVLTSEWIETPEALVVEEPEKPELPEGTWVKMNEPYDGHLEYGWVAEKLGGRPWRGVKRYWYGLALIHPEADWPDFVDFKDTEFEVVRPPRWAEQVRDQIEDRKR